MWSKLPSLVTSGILGAFCRERETFMSVLSIIYLVAVVLVANRGRLSQAPHREKKLSKIRERSVSRTRMPVS